MTPIVFLHIPKTAGQTIHNQLAQMVGADAVSPVRVHSQALNGPQMPVGYSLYSGHIDWTELGTLADPFVFTVLRDPAERIASFYFYLLGEARKLSEQDLQQPGNRGKANVLALSAEDYFFGGSAGWQTFVRDHYDNFYCAYFATQRMRGGPEIRACTASEAVNRAMAGLTLVDRVYHTERLDILEHDILGRFGQKINVTGNYVNAGEIPRDQARWPKLINLLDSDAARRRLEDFAARDVDLMARVRFAEA